VSGKILTAEGTIPEYLSQASARLFDVNNPVVILCRGISVIGGGFAFGWSWYGSLGSLLGGALGFVALYLSEKYQR
jgi:hypothetical protein